MNKTTAEPATPYIIYHYLHLRQTCVVRYNTVHLLKKFNMDAQLNKDERIEIRISAHDKRIFQKAQKLSGDKSFSSFIVRVVKKHAEDIVAKNDRIIASERDRDTFFKAVFGDAKPNSNLMEAAKKYKSQTGL